MYLTNNTTTLRDPALMTYCRRKIFVTLIFLTVKVHLIEMHIHLRRNFFFFTIYVKCLACADARSCILNHITTSKCENRRDFLLSKIEDERQTTDLFTSHKISILSSWIARNFSWQLCRNQSGSGRALSVRTEHQFQFFN